VKIRSVGAGDVTCGQKNRRTIMHNETNSRLIINYKLTVKIINYKLTVKIT